MCHRPLIVWVKMVCEFYMAFDPHNCFLISMWYKQRAITLAGLVQYVQTTIFQLETIRHLLQDWLEGTFKKKAIISSFFCHFS